MPKRAASRNASTTSQGARADTPTLRVRGASDIAAAIPYLLGFHPVRSLVLMGFDAADRGQVVVTARIDLADVAASPAALQHTLSGVARGRAGAVVAAIFDDDAEPDVGAVAAQGLAVLPWAGLAREVEQTAGEFGLVVDEVMLVTGGRSWSYLCDNPGCCPVEGCELDSSPVPAECTYAGLVALPDRAALESTLDPLPDDERERLLFALDLAEYDAVGTILSGADERADRSDKRAIYAAARAAHDTNAPAVSDEQVVRFGIALQRLSVRDAVWLAIDDGRLDGRPLWADLARRLPRPYDAAPLFLFAWASYREGNGALAGIAAERALASDPKYSAADMVLAALAHALDPRTLPKLRNRLRSA